ncbi:restriction endonuclease subunit S [Lacticaseibacillus saniviri]|uniref:restriction endonuclease subunit S n=1 Tax=Lacticaseibacillus saniviri TaxID=931533 RepID=UPI001EDF298B|nr:restriction endonuclease subunit S [Lacticaseibacillus saniviri]MCG4281456.1 restriction endonuclease subunit S [Lacticaseibacillus saniviri]
MNANQAKYPQLRFKGFTDPWEQHKVSELADRYDNLRIPITASERVTGETPYYGANGIQDYVKGFTHNGEFVLVAEDGANDLQNYPIQYVDGKVWVNNHAHVLQAKEEIVDNKFLTNALKHTNIEPYLVGGGRAKLNADVMMKINFKVPTLPEQVQIGKFFDNLNHLITLHQRKVAKLKELKQGYLQKLFPKNGSKFPQLRFAGFADAWEQRELGDLGDILRKSIDPQLTPSREFVEYSMPSYDRGKRPNRVLGESMQSTRLKISGTVLLINKLNVRQRRIWFVKKAPENAVASGEFVPFQSFEIDLGFLHQLFLSDKTTSELQSISSGTSNSQKRVTPSDLLHYPICIPTTKGEQVVVGRFLSSIDNTITLHQRKLEKLQELKKGYLQKMFC